MQCHVNWNPTPEQISNGIADITVVCLTHGVNAVFILLMICRKNNYSKGKVTKINFLLSHIFKEMYYILRLKI